MSWADTQTKRGSQSFLGSNLPELDYIVGAVAGKPRLILETLKTSVRNFKLKDSETYWSIFTFFRLQETDACLKPSKIHI